MTAARRPEPHNTTALANLDHASLPVGVEMTAAAAASQAKAMVAARYLVAFERPRDWKRVEERIMAACDRPAFAEEALYLLEKGGSQIEGLSVRFAEESARWIGNLMVESIVTYDDDTQRTVRVIATDLEANVTYPTDVVVDKTVERRSSAGREVLGKRTNSQNQVTYRVRATDDEIMVKQNSLVSKARRNGILLMLPADMQESAKQRVKQTTQNVAKGTESRKSAIPSMILAFGQLEVPVTEEMLEGFLGHPVEQVTPEEFAKLRGFYQAVKDGETTWETIAQGRPQQRARRNPSVRSEGYDEGQPVKAEVKHMADRPVMSAPHRTTAGASDEYHCTHGVALTDRCEECVADEAEAAGGQ